MLESTSHCVISEAPSSCTADMATCEADGELRIEPLAAPHLRRGFLETLSALTEVALTPDAAVAVLQKRLWAGIRTYVVVQGGHVVGTASLIIEPKFLHGGGTVAHVEDVAVHHDAQGHGIGRLLMDHCERVARQQGCYKIILDCSRDRQPFYEKYGYREHELQMRKDLPAAPHE